MFLTNGETHETADISGFDGSFSYTNEESLRLSGLPAIYHFGEVVDFGIGAGITYRRWKVTEIGSFEFGSLQTFDNRYTVDQVGIMIGFRSSYVSQQVVVRYRAECLPAPRTSIDPTIQISLLVTTDGRNSDMTWSGSSFQQEITAIIGSYFGATFYHSWDQLVINLLGLAVDDSEYIFSASKSEITTVSFRMTGS